jgi:hypothetical protein
VDRRGPSPTHSSPMQRGETAPFDHRSPAGLRRARAGASAAGPVRVVVDAHGSMSPRESWAEQANEGIPMEAHLSSRHRDTVERIFSHPPSRNIEWREVVSLLETI